MTTTDVSKKYPHLKGNFATLADEDDKRRIYAIRAGAWINYARAKNIIDRMDELLAYPRIERMPNLLIVGESNNGKTEIMKRFMQKHLPDPNPDGNAAFIEAIKVDAPPTPDFGDLCSRILDEINAPYRSTSPASVRLQAVKKILEIIGTRILLIDEIHNMLTGGAVKQREFRNAIKDLGNGLKISIVAAGIEEASLVFATDPQLSNRFETAALPKWKLDQETGRLLASMEQRLPLRQPSNLKSAELMQKIVFMSEGIIGEIHAVLKAAAIAAIKNGVECITLEVLSGLPWKKPSERKSRPSLA